ncbi:helix-turn-helix domain-containing protein [Empedobacter falsenii]|uniref:helix-turn-helix domain-containing protein n=1 Tax=Empedobacter falsenii TaxID=343874 RepID=UPI003A7F9DE5
MNSDKNYIIDEIKKHLGFTKDSELADFLGIGQSTISNWRRRNTLDYELILSKCEDLDANWLFRGVGNMLISDKNEDNSELLGKNITQIEEGKDSNLDNYLKLIDKIENLDENKTQLLQLFLKKNNDLQIAL